MGTCQSLYDEDEIRRQEEKKRQARELQHFQQQLRASRCFSELDINGRGITRKTKTIQPTAEQVRVATNIIYDA
jgi:hypothetical protein